MDGNNLEKKDCVVLNVTMAQRRLIKKNLYKLVPKMVAISDTDFDTYDDLLDDFFRFPHISFLGGEINVFNHALTFEREYFDGMYDNIYNAKRVSFEEFLEIIGIYQSATE